MLINREQIYKLYKRKVDAGGRKDYVRGIEFFQGYKSTGELMFIGWYGITDLSGAIRDKRVNGLRLRKKNILIGDNKTADKFFGNNPTYQNFNRWFLGEIYVYDDELIPNARRDDFEQGDEYSEFAKEVRKTTAEKLRKMPHALSRQRTENKTIGKCKKTISQVKKDLDKGLTSTSKEKFLEKLEKSETQLKRVSGKRKDPQITSAETVTNTSILKERDILVETIQELKNEVESTRNYKISRIPSNYSKCCKNALKMVFEVIDRVLVEGQAKELQERIIEEFCKQKKKKTR